MGSKVNCYNVVMELRSNSARRVEEILDVLLTRKRYGENRFTYKGISFDLVLVLTLPPEQLVPIDKEQVLTIGEIRKTVPHELNEAYTQAIEAIQHETNHIEKNRVYLNYCGGLSRNSDNEFNQRYRTLNVLNVFELMYNTLVYTLQKDCGFHCEKIIVMGHIFLLLNCTDENLMRAAQKYGLKKEVLYSQIDIMLNQPLDSRYRPLRFNRFLVLNSKDQREHRLPSEQHIDVIASQVHIEKGDEGIFNLTHHKRWYRKIDSAPATEEVEYIQEQQQLSNDQIISYYKYLKEYYVLLGRFNSLTEMLARKGNSPAQKGLPQRKDKQVVFEEPAEVAATNHQLSRVRDRDPQNDEGNPVEPEEDAEMREYLKLLMPEKRLNKGCFTMLRRVRNRQAYFILVKDLMQRLGYRVFDNPSVYTSFFRLSKHKKFADRLQTLLMFKPLVVGPEKKTGLFLRMERTKLAYLIVEEFLRIENFPRMGLEVFAMHNTYEKNGKKSSALLLKEIPTKEGGLDGLNLQENWNIWTPWRVNHKLIRDYLGEKPAFFVMLKSHMILFLLIASPIAVVAYSIILAVIPYFGTEAIHINQFFFFLILQLLLVSWLTLLSAEWEHKSSDYMSSFVEKRIRKSVLPGYQAPYVRNLVSDLVNDFRETKSWKGILIESANYLIVVCILGLEIAIFYGIRVLNNLLTENIYDRSFVRWQELLPVFIFFFGNQIVYSHILKRFFRFLTTLENNPDLEKNDSNRDSKRLMFLIGLQLIGPIDMLLVEPMNRTSCGDRSCFDAFDTFIESRFIVIFIMLLGRFLWILLQLLVAKIRNRSVSKEVHQSMSPRQSEQGALQYEKLIRKLVKEYGMKEFQTNMEDEIMVLVHIALFSVTLPIAIVINLIHVLLEYYLERLQVLHSCRRPINFRSLEHSPTMLRLPIYLFCVVNAWMQFVTFEDWEYIAPNFFSWVLEKPTLESVLTFKIMTSLVWAVLLMLISKLIRQIYEEYTSNQSIRTRTNYKLKEYLYNFRKGSRSATAANHEPFRFIGRTQAPNH